MTQICIALIGSYASNVKNNKKVAKVRLFYLIIKFLLQNESECIILLKFGSLAQLVEHLTLNQGVQGSNPWRSTTQTAVRTAKNIMVFKGNVFGIVKTSFDRLVFLLNCILFFVISILIFK